jgi:hypothetical protein
MPERFMREPERSSIHDRLANVESQTAHIPQVLATVERLEKDVASWKQVEALVKGIVTKGILLIVGAVASAVGVTKVTETPQPTQTTVVTKSATTVKVEACTALQAGPERDACAIRILTELMGSR